MNNEDQPQPSEEKKEADNQPERPKAPQPNGGGQKEQAPEQQPGESKTSSQEAKPQPEKTPAPSQGPKPQPEKPMVPAEETKKTQPQKPRPGPIISKPITRKKPGPPEKEEEGMDRRSFLMWLTVGWGAFAAIVAGYGTLMMRYMFPNVLFEPKQTFTAGEISDYTIGEVSTKYKERFGVWIVRDQEKIYALSTVCTHLGCTPNWLPNENKFKCPCHGSGFYKSGVNFEGPAPRPLERYAISLSDEGNILIDKTKKFQQEKGEWDDPESYILA